MTRRESMFITHAWLQKHATPTADGGEFHWHPAGHAQPALVERLRGAVPPCVLWELSPGRVVWAQAFAAVAPGDGRRYIGLVATIAERAGATPAELLAELRVPPARPWDREAQPVDGDRDVGDGARELLGDGVAIAGALLDGGDAAIAAPAEPRLPRVIAQLEELAERSPGVAERTRCGAWRSGSAAAAVASPSAELLAAAWRDGGDAARAYRAACELATRGARADRNDSERAVGERIGDRITALSGELAKLEARTRAVVHGLADERARDRRALWIVAGGVALANAMIAIALVGWLVRAPAAREAAPIATPSPAAPPIAAVPAAAPVDAGVELASEHAPDAASGSGSACATPAASRAPAAPATASPRAPAKPATAARRR